MPFPVIALALACSSPPALPAGSDTLPDIVLVSIDSLRRDHLGFYGYSRDTAPKLGAEKTLLFTQARSASPWTLPAHMTMMTGLWPTEHGVIEDNRKLSPDIPTLAEKLQAAGYATGGFVATIYVSGSYGFARGFDTYNDFNITDRNNLTHPVRAELVVSEALNWARAQAAGKPIFLFLHFYDVHYPYDPPAPYNTRIDPAADSKTLSYRKYGYYTKNQPSKKRFSILINQYDECIGYVDDVLGGLWLAFSQRRLDWVVTADHGEEFGERGSWGHAHTLYPEALNIPMVMGGPDFVPGIREERVGHVDLAPTLAGLAGVQFVPGAGVDLRGAVPDRPFLAETSRFDTARVSVEADGMRYERDVGDGQTLLFDRNTDPGEKSVLGEDRADLAALLAKKLGEPCVFTPRAEGERLQTPAKAQLWQGGGMVVDVGAGPFLVFPLDALEKDQRVKCASGAVNQSLDAETRAQLDALGYTQGEGSVNRAGP